MLQFIDTNIVNISLKGHSFQAQDDIAMGKTVWKIAERNVLSTGISGLRVEGGYKLIAGHSRKRVSELAGKTIMPVLIRDLDNDEATIIMIHSIFQC